MLLELNTIGKPPVGAGPLMVTVAVEFVPETTEVGFSDRAVTPGGVTVSVVVLVAPANVPVIVAVAEVATGVVPAVKVVEVSPAETITEAGTVTAALFDVRVTVYPPAGAGPPRVTVPVEDVPPVTDV